MEKQISWSRLDNTAKLFPAISGEHAANVFRLWADLEEDIHPKALQEAVEQALKDLPAFAVKMRRGVFWYYFEQNPAKPVVREEFCPPCFRIELRRNWGFLFRITYYQRRVNLEVFHALTDGNGALYFLHHILFYYLKQVCPAASHWEKPAELEDVSEQEMWEDGFAKSDEESAGAAGQPMIFAPRAYHLDGEMLPIGAQQITEAVFSAKEIAGLAKASGATVAQYFAALLIEAILEERCREVPPKEKIVISLPVNLRNFFPSKTLRNFFIFVRIGVDGSQGNPGFDNILAQVGEQMKGEITREKFLARIRQQRRLEEIPFLRVVPRVIKDFFMRRTYRRGEHTYTCTLTNMGRVPMPREFVPHVKRIGTMLGASRNNTLKVAVSSLGDVMTVVFNSTCREEDIPRYFIRRLTAEGLAAVVTCNEVPR